MRTERQIDNSANTTPALYRQPEQGFIGRSVVGSIENVDYVPGTHVRIWYNCSTDGFEAHLHKAIEIITCVENGYTVCSNDRTYVLNRGDIIVIPPGLLHRLPGGKQGARFIMLFDLSPLEGFRDIATLSSLFADPILISAAGNGKLYSRVHDLLLHIVSLYFENSSMWELSVYADLFAFFSAIGCDHFAGKNSFSTEVGRSNATYEKFNNLMDYIDEHYAEEISLDSAAAYVGFSKFHFSRLFKEYSGTTFYNVLRRRRIRAAQALLTTGLSVSDIAYQTGFSSLASFGRSFKEQTGMTPTDYRTMQESFSGHMPENSTYSDPFSQ